MKKFAPQRQFIYEKFKHVQAEDVTTDSISVQDSGIGKDISESTTSRSSKGQHSMIHTERSSQGHRRKGIK